MEKLVIVGMGVNAKQAYSIVTSYGLFEVVGFAVDEKYKTCNTFMEKPVFTLENLNQEINKEEVKLFVALLWNRLNADRRDLYLRLKAEGYMFANIISPKASVRGTINGDNCWIHDYAVIQHNAVIGDNVAIMSYSLVGDGCQIGSHCFLGAKSTIAGGSRVGEQTFVGINCTVFDGTNIGSKCILGACTAVKRNMPDCSSIKTSSDIIIKQYDEEIVESKLMFKKNIR